MATNRFHSWALRVPVGLGVVLAVALPVTLLSVMSHRSGVPRRLGNAAYLPAMRNEREPEVINWRVKRLAPRW